MEREPENHYDEIYILKLLSSSHTLKGVVFKFFVVCWFMTPLQDIVGEDVVCILVGNKADLLEQREDRADQGSTVEQREERQMTVTLTRHPRRVLTTDAMKLAQVLYYNFLLSVDYFGDVCDKLLIGNYPSDIP
jgi:hypothetical protein